MNKSVLISIGIALFFFSCQRDFDSPSPEPRIDELEPLQGFMGDWIEVKGSNFDSRAENNLVFFGTQSAKVLEAQTTSLMVEVPELQDDEEAYLKVSTSMGQTTSEQPFTYKGPGHPVDEKIDHSIVVEWSPLAVTSNVRYDLDTPSWVLVAHATGRTVSLLNTDSGQHYDFGVQHTPLSVTAVRQGETYKAYLTTLKVDPANQLILESHLKVLSIVISADQAFPEISLDLLDQLPNLYGMSFQPAKVWSYCTTMELGECVQYGLVMSHLFGSALLTWDVAGEVPLDILELDKEACPDDKPIRTATVMDLRYYADQARFIITLKDSPEIWSVPVDAGQCPSRIWPTQDAPAADWFYRFAAMERLGAANSDDSRLFVTDTGQNVLLELNDPPGGLLTRRSQTPLGSKPYTAQIAETANQSGRLYVATENGILGFDLSRDAPVSPLSPLPLVATIPLDGCSGSTQSLGLINHDLQTADVVADEVLFADTVRDVLRIFRPGAETVETRKIQLGHTAPQLASSHLSETWYIADPMTNIVRLMDRRSGIQSAQFAILDESAFGTPDIACLNANGAEVLLSPLPKAQLPLNAQAWSLNKIVVRRADQEDDLQEWVDQGYEKLSEDVVYVMSTGAESFHTMLPAVKNRALYLVRYGFGIIPGRLWTLELDLQSESATDILVTEENSSVGPSFGFIDLELDPQLELVRLSQDQNALITLGRPKGLPPEVHIIPLNNPESAYQVTIEGLLPYMVSDMALIASNGQSNQPSLYLALPPLGQVASYHQGQLHFIETTGFPFQLYPSPDGRRLYVTHASEGKISIIDTDCRPEPACEQLLGNLSVDSYPHKVVFTASGDEALVTHLDSNEISVIE